MTRVVFVDAADQAAWIRASMPVDAATMLVALTPAAMRALEAHRLAYTPVSAFADLHPLAAADEALNQRVMALAAEIETYLGGRHAPVKFDGPGLLTANSYALQYSVTAIVRRGLLMRQAVEYLAPSAIAAFPTAHAWFTADGYLRDPWLDVLAADAERRGMPLEWLPAPPPLPMPQDSAPVVDRVRSKIRRGRRRLAEALSWRADSPQSDLTDLRLLFAPSVGFDWAAVIALLPSASGTSCHRAPTFMPHAASWSESFEQRLEAVVGGRTHTLSGTRPTVDDNETETLLRAFGDWGRSVGAPSLHVAGFDVFPGLRRQIQEMLRWSPALIRYGDSVADRMMDAARPDAVCFFSIGNLATRRFAHVARTRGVPVVSYQHGFGYSIRVQPQDEQSDPMHADYFLTYGEGNRARANPAFPVRAEYVPVGSARIERMMRRPRPHTRRRARIVWASEYWIGNTLTVFATEETGRFDLYRRCLDRMRALDADVTYRPYPGAPDPVRQWLRDQRWPVRTNATDTFDEVMRDADLAIVTTSSPTIWGEVLALGVPMVLYCDPEQTLLTASFMADLDRVCRWCRSGEALFTEIDTLAADVPLYIERLKRLDTGAFLRKYLIHEGRCAMRAAAFLSGLRGRAAAGSSVEADARIAG